jgi:hypothetical protein
MACYTPKDWLPPKNNKLENTKRAVFIDGVPVLIQYKQFWDVETKTWRYRRACRTDSLLRVATILLKRSKSPDGIAYYQSMINQITVSMVKTPVTVSPPLSKQQLKRRRRQRESQEQCTQTFESMLSEYKKDKNKSDIL